MEEKDIIIEETAKEETAKEEPISEEKKKKKKGKGIYTLLMVICVGVFIFALYNVIDIMLEYKEIEDYYEITIDEYVQVDEDGMISYVDLAKLVAKNSDVKGWIYIDGTDINYPLLQGPNNDYYLYRNYDEEYSGAGSIYIEAGNEGDLSDDHTVIYGHNMKNDTMFGTLNEFKVQSHMEAHPYVYILNPSGSWYQYEIFGYYRADVSDGTFDLFTGNPDRMTEYVNLVASKNYYDNLKLPRDGEKIITLSTCTEDLDDNCRNVLQAKLIGTVDKIS